MPRTLQFLITLDLPLGVTVEELRDYILVEVKSGAGLRDPMRDPLSDLDRESVKVSRFHARPSGVLSGKWVVVKVGTWVGRVGRVDEIVGRPPTQRARVQFGSSGPFRTMSVKNLRLAEENEIPPGVG